MYCRYCGSENADNSRYCRNCGADMYPQEYGNSGNYGNSQNYGASSMSEPSVSVNLLLTIAAVALAILYGQRAVRVIWSAIMLLTRSSSLPAMLRGLLNIGLIFVICAALCYVLLVFGLRRTQETTEPLYLGVIILAGARIVWALIWMLILSVTYLVSWYGLFQDLFGSLVFTFLKTALCAGLTVGVLFLLLTLAGRRPFAGRSKEELAAMLGELPNILLNSNIWVKDKTSRTDADGAAYGQNYNQGYAYAQNGGQNYSQNPGQSMQPQPMHRPDDRLKTDRSLLKYILFSIITCGIYNYIFYYEIAKDINKICWDDGKKTTGLVGYIVFTIITCGIYSFVWHYKFAERLADNAPSYGVNIREGGSTVLLWMIVGAFLCGIGPFVAIHTQIKNLNAMAKAYNARYYPEMNESHTQPN